MGKMGFLQNTTPEKKTEKQTLIVDDTFRHSYSMGQTGCGKTSSFIYPNLDDRISQGNGILIFDYKGKEHTSVKYLANKHDRLSDVMEIGLPWGENCNLIQYFNEKELFNFVKGIMSLGEKDAYWSTSSANLVVTIGKILKAYIDVIKATDDHNLQDSLYTALKRHRLPSRLTFADIATVLSSHTNIVRFVRNALKVYDKFEKIIELNIQELVMKLEQDDIKEMYLNLVTTNMEFKSILDREKKSLDIFIDSKEANTQTNTIQTLILSMSTTFSVITTNEKMNDYNGIDIAKELNDGKILIINAQELSDTIISTLTASILQELSKRIQQKEIRPVSVFIDEAQRVLNKDIDLHTDILRESKVELFLAFQNHQLMINTLGKDKFYALIQNLSSSYVFANSLDFQEFETSKLETFEYYHKDSETVHLAEPMFLDEDEVFDAVLKYCNDNKLYNKLNIPMEHRDKVVQFNPYLYKENSIELKDRDGDITIVKLRDPFKEQKAAFIIEDIIGMHKVKLQKQNVTYEPSRSLKSVFDEKMNEIDDFLGVENE